MTSESPKQLAERLLDHLQQYIENAEELINQLYDFDNYSEEEQKEILEEAEEYLQ